MEINRRNFLKLSVAGGAGMLCPSPLSASVESVSGLTLFNAKALERRPLGKTGIKLPILSMGVMRADNPNLVKAALNSGITHFDTANGYQEGRNESMLGKVFSEVPREKIVIATKINLKKDIFTENAPEKFLEMFEESMARLQVKYVDILYLHAIADPKMVSHPPVMEVMKKLQAEGRAKHLGISTHQNEPEVIKATVEAGIYDVVLTSYNFKQKHVEEVKQAISLAASKGLGVIAMKTMAGAKNVNCGAALKWAMQNKDICTAIPGYTTFDQLEECVTACAKPKLTKEERYSLTASADSAENLYCQQCKQCDGQCPKGLPIPDLMRGYMYNFGYQFPSKARELVDELAIGANPCGECGSCTVKCSSGFDVAGRINSIARISNVPKEFLV